MQSCCSLSHIRREREGEREREAEAESEGDGDGEGERQKHNLEESVAKFLQLVAVREDVGAETLQPAIDERTQLENARFQVDHPTAADRGWRRHCQVLYFEHHRHVLRQRKTTSGSL